jgi:hypothetical protein
MKRTPLLLLVVVAVLALLAAGCGKDDAPPASAGAPTTSTTADDDTSTTAAGGGSDSTTTTAATGDEEAGPTDTPEATARANLATLLEEHVYLGGIAISSLVSNGSASPVATAAAGALDDNSVALGDAVSAAFDATIGEDFLSLWRGHITDYVDYTSARQLGDDAAASAAVDRLDQFRSDTADLLESASDEALSADAAAEGLDVHVDAVLAVIDATVSGSPDAVPLLREAASHVPDMAATWAAAFTASRAS